MTASGETWRIVRSAPEVLASSEGRVMRMPYANTTPTGYHTYGGQPGFGTWCRREGRFVFTVAGKTYRVARLVCEAFSGPPPFPGAITLHIDERASNNRASNVRAHMPITTRRRVTSNIAAAELARAARPSRPGAGATPNGSGT